MCKFSGGQVFIEDRLQECDIYVQNGTISCILPWNTVGPDCDEIIDCKGKVILPGSIDTHVHIREPGSEHRETFETGTMAAAAGGVTTVCEHPISVPPPHNGELLERRKEIATPQLFTDICFFGALGSDSIIDAQEMKEHGAVAFKTFLQEAMPGREKEFEGMLITNDYDLREALKETARLGMIAAFHAENNDIIVKTINRMKAEGYVEPQAHFDSRPIISEVECVNKLLLMAEETGAQILICHVSCGEAMQLIKEAKARGVHVLAETCPHYLFECEEEAVKKGVFARCNPPIRNRLEMNSLWMYVEDGTVDIIGSDHGPYTLEEKERGIENIFLAPAGFPGLETRVHLMLGAVADGRISIGRMVKLLSERPAEIFGLARKGYLREGYDADMILVDFNKEYQIDKNKMYTKGRDTCLLFDGRVVHGVIEKTVLRGRVIADNGIVNRSCKGYGRIIIPEG